jgi:polyribonucleotide nucleotidyltransferase
MDNKSEDSLNEMSFHSIENSYIMNDSNNENKQKDLELSISQQNLLINKIESKSELLICEKNKLINEIDLLQNCIKEVENKETQLLEVVSLINSDDFESNSDLYLNELSHNYSDLLLKFESFDSKNDDSVDHTINQVFINVYINLYLI